MPRSKLRTPAGVDHDYNFLHGIELSVERSEKLLTEEKGIVQAEELRPLTMQQVKWKIGRDGRRRKVIETRLLREAKGRSFERNLAQRLRKLNVQIICAPRGMQRQKENQTTLNRRTGRINWQVEWLQLQLQLQPEPGKTPVRHLSKVMDDVPLFAAYAATLQQPGKPGRGSRAGETQSSVDATWNLGRVQPMQDPDNGVWFAFGGSEVDAWPAGEEHRQKTQFKFFLAGPPSRSDQPTRVTALAATDCLRDILTNTRVLEFPTIYVLPAADQLPDTYVLLPKDTVGPISHGTKRKDGTDAAGKGSAGTGAYKRQRRDGGSVGSGDDDEEDGSKGTVGLEAGDVVAEQSVTEDDGGDDDDDDDTTSSSGSDSESG